MKFPLYAKILGWFFLNLIFVATAFLLVAHGQFHLGLDSLMAGPAGARFQNVTQLLADELRNNTQSDWNAILGRFDDVYKVQFSVFERGQQLAGATVSLPAEISAHLALRPARTENHHPDFSGHPPDSPSDSEGPMRAPPGEFESRGGSPPEHAHGPPLPRTMIHTTNPSRYWVLVPANLKNEGRPPRANNFTIVAVADNLSGGGLFFDLTSWAIAGGAVLIVSVLFWLPLVRGLTRSISRMTRATEAIAEGRFEVRTDVQRRDELGTLSEAINRMAVRLGGFVTGQKRFLGDIAHELCSPIARIQVALGILEQRADAKQSEYLADLREEVEQMSSLVNELLSFSKTALGAMNAKLTSVALRDLLEKTVARETGVDSQATFQMEVPKALLVKGDPELLMRAFGNIIRNAIHYAGKFGPITISAIGEGAFVTVAIADQGPGIPASALPQLFDPFFRVDPSRDRATGGVGLGLSIVKTCVETCGGAVSCENITGGGLKISVKLAAV